MRTQISFVLLMYVASASSAYADGLIVRLPADGAWVRYAINQTMIHKKEKNAVTGTLTLASVGRVKLDDDMGRWIEIVLDAKIPDDEETVSTVFKALIPEKHLKKGADPLQNWVKGWVKTGEAPARPLKKELLTNPALVLNLVISGPVRDAKVIEKTTIETKLGKLECEGVEGSFVLKDAAINIVDGRATVADAKGRLRSLFHDKAPFGVASFQLKVDFPDVGRGEASAEATLTLSEIGEGAKSRLPDLK